MMPIVRLLLLFLILIPSHPLLFSKYSCLLHHCKWFILLLDRHFLPSVEIGLFVVLSYEVKWNHNLHLKYVSFRKWHYWPVCLRPLFLNSIILKILEYCKKLTAEFSCQENFSKGCALLRLAFVLEVMHSRAITELFGHFAAKIIQRPSSIFDELYCSCVGFYLTLRMKVILFFHLLR